MSAHKPLVANELHIVNQDGQPVFQVSGNGPQPGLWFSNPQIKNQRAGVYLSGDGIIVSLHDGQPDSKMSCVAVGCSSNGVATLQYEISAGETKVFSLEKVFTILEAFGR
jgi:hypothetical protein